MPNPDTTRTRQIKQELTNVIIDAVNEFLNTPHGSKLLDRVSRTTPTQIQVVSRDAEYFSIKVAKNF